MKRKIAIFFVIIIFLAGLSIMLYPVISSFVNNMNYRDSMVGYVENVAQMQDESIVNHFKDADDYNKSLTGNMILTDPFDEEVYKSIGADYEGTFDVDDKGLIGYIEIPKINVYLPISHGTSEEVLQKGAGHLQNTSFPVGGESTHSVISAHTGYPGKSFFDYIDDLELGDEFYIYVLDRTLKYQVDDITVILPHETEGLRIRTGEDYVTLLTCTPYGINTHRLLVRGTRVEYTPETITTEFNPISMDKGCMYLFGYKIPYWIAGCIVGGFVLLVIIIVAVAVKSSRKKVKREAIKSSNKEE